MLGMELRTSEVIVIFTTPDATIVALRVAADLGRSWNAPIRLIAPMLLSQLESQALRARIANEIDAPVSVIVCLAHRVADLALALFNRHSLIVIGGRQSWWPTRQERMRRALEAQGHRVLFVNEGH